MRLREIIKKKYSLLDITSIFIQSPLKYPYLPLKGSVRLSAMTRPEDISADVTWSTSDPAVATVDSQGNVTACGKGTAVINASAAGAESVTASYKITVPDIEKSRVRFIAHRGHSGIAPENTRAAYRLAAESPYFDAIECDIRRTRDGVFVNQHDNNMKRIFGVDVNITEVDYDTIKDLTATGGSGMGKYPAEEVKPCRLEEYLDILRNSDKRAVIELKDVYSQELTDELYDLISSYGMNSRLDYISFHYQALLNITRSMNTFAVRNPGRAVIKPDLYLLTSSPWKNDPVIGDSTPAAWALSHGYNLSISHKKLTAETVRMAHLAGRKVSVWTVDSCDCAAHYIFGLGVDCITTNITMRRAFLTGLTV
ncbi:MAG: Ig-like domain-containing protein [Eubacterium sp.]|nr:Ig-like domain-containing protein [Eubacterium sp.]